jgi:hypothetical protein
MKDINWIGYRIVSKIGLWVIAFIVAIGFSQMGVLATLVSVAFLAIPAVWIVLDGRMSAAGALIFVAAATLSAAGWAWDLYRFNHFDFFVHVLGTVAMTLFITSYIYAGFLKVFAGHGWLLTITVISIGLAVGAGWEIVEYFLIPAAKMGLYDTVTDLVTDLVGAVVSVPIVFWDNKARLSPSFQEYGASQDG